jgi:hypothetical protein
MITFGSPKFSIDIIFRPGLNYSERELAELHSEILEVGQSCLDEIPDYQCLSGRREEYSRLIISVARGDDGKMLGFCSSYVLDAGKLGTILHLGLTCVTPAARRLGLTHRLTSKVVVNYLINYSLFKSTWISNVACVLSSLGNVALHFDDVYPSPFMEEPSDEHRQVAELINHKYRSELYVRKEATFDAENFVFERSVSGTMFEKSAGDRKFYHRDQDLTHFYMDLIDFENGDEVLQIGKISLMSFPFYLLKSIRRKMSMTRFLDQGETVA